MKRQIEKIVKLIDGCPLSQDMLTDRNKSKKHLENVLQRMQAISITYLQFTGDG